MTLRQRLPQPLEQTLRAIELGSIIVLLLATVASAWCGYQATLWSGIQTFELHDADRLGRLAARYEVQADQLRSVDVALFVQYLTLRARGESDLANFLRQRFRPEANAAVNAWYATDPEHNLNAPAHPFLMPEYHIAQLGQARNVHRQASQERASAQGVTPPQVGRS